MKRLSLVFVFLLSNLCHSQDPMEETKSNIQEFTPSKLLSKGQWDIKWFNNLYTETKQTFNGVKSDKLRETFFTSSLDVFTGVSNNDRLNIGLLIELRSNVIGGGDALDVFKFDGNSNSARSGITSFAPAVKFNPIKSLGNFTIQSAFHIPLVSNEIEHGVFLDQKGFTFQNRFFYDYNFSGDSWQLFTELNTEYHFGKKEASFANNSLSLTPGVFLSYFPNSKFTVLILAQHSQRIDTGNDFAQNYTAIGSGAKYQVTKRVNIETLYTNFVRGNNTGLGQTFNIGLRALF